MAQELVLDDITAMMARYQKTCRYTYTNQSPIIMHPDLKDLLDYRNHKIITRYNMDYPTAAMQAEEALHELMKFIWLCHKHKTDKLLYPDDKIWISLVSFMLKWLILTRCGILFFYSPEIIMSFVIPVSTEFFFIMTL